MSRELAPMSNPKNTTTPTTSKSTTSTTSTTKTSSITSKSTNPLEIPSEMGVGTMEISNEEEERREEEDEINAPSQKVPSKKVHKANGFYGFIPVNDDNDEDENGNDENSNNPRTEQWISLQRRRQEILNNFLVMSIFFSLNHGATVACLSLATARLGNRLGVWQSGILSLSYTLSALFGATYIVKELGPKHTLLVGLWAYVIYVGCFVLATSPSLDPIFVSISVILGAVLGGVGGGFLWTAQGTYFAHAAEDYASVLIIHNHNHQSNVDPFVDEIIEEEDADVVHRNMANSKLSGIFAAIYLMGEFLLRLSSSFLAQPPLALSWRMIFTVYTIVAILSALGMTMVRPYGNSNNNNINNNNNENEDDDEQGDDDDNQQQQMGAFHKATAAWRLFLLDPKMKYMIGLIATFGFASAFLNSYVNGEVIQSSLSDTKSTYVGYLTSITTATAATCSLIFGTSSLSKRIGNGPILILGSISFFLMAAMFIFRPSVNGWHWTSLSLVYMLQGIGRATYEGTTRATFADYFDTEKEGAFANIVIFNGLSTALGFFLSLYWPCLKKEEEEGMYCVQYRDGSFHNVLAFELLIMITAIFGMIGFWRASILFQWEREGNGNGNGNPATPLIDRPDNFIQV